MASKKAEAKVERTRVSEAAAMQFLERWAKKHDLKGKELDHKVKLIAATRLMALDRYVHQHQAKAKPGKARRRGKKAAKK